MTKPFERLREEPQTNINIGETNFEERQQVRRIKIQSTPGRLRQDSAGKFTGVYYIVGDEKAAAEKFVRENQERLDKIDFSKRNVIDSNVSRETYDWILHAVGERILTKYETVVRESRPDGGDWIIDREKFESTPNRRYTTNESGSTYLPPATTSEEMYSQFEDIITEEDLTRVGIEGDVRQLLDFFRVSPDFDCEPITAEEGLAVRKHPKRSKKS
jgi:hypothetical protein